MGTATHMITMGAAVTTMHMNTMGTKQAAARCSALRSR